MRTQKRIIYSVIIVLVLAGLYHVVTRQSKQPQVTAVSVTASPVLQKDATITYRGIGNVQPFNTVSVKSRVDGQLLSVGFKEGDFVKQDQIIFQIDPRPFQVQLQEAEATLARDQAQLINYQTILSRYTPLTTKGYISKQDYDQANANVKAQAALVLADQAAVGNAKLNLEYCTIRAPISGKTGGLLVNKGNLVKATDVAPLVVINQIMPIYVAFSLPEQHLAAIIDEMKIKSVFVQIAVKQPNKRLQAQLSFIDNTVDKTTGTIQLKALFPNQNEELWPGLYVDVVLPIYQIKKALLVPTRAIQADPEGPFVFVVQSGVVHKKIIKEGPPIHGDTVIEGLQPGEMVVTTGQAQLIDGSLVTISTALRSPS